MRAFKPVTWSCAFAVMLGAAMFIPGVAQAAPVSHEAQFPPVSKRRSGARRDVGGRSGVRGQIGHADRPRVHLPTPARELAHGGGDGLRVHVLGRERRAQAQGEGDVHRAGGGQSSRRPPGTSPPAAAVVLVLVRPPSRPGRSRSTQYKVLPESPIESVLPATAWTSPSTSVSTATAVKITASEYLGTHTKSSFTKFRSWFVFGGGQFTISGPQGDRAARVSRPMRSPSTSRAGCLPSPNAKAPNAFRMGAQWLLSRARGCRGPGGHPRVAQAARVAARGG